MLGSALTEALTTPLWKWNNPSLVEAATSPVQYIDVAQPAGLTSPNVWGGVDHKRSIIEAKGSGLAFFDYDHDGWLDIYLTNGDRLDTQVACRKSAHLTPLQEQSRRHVYRRYGEIRLGPDRMADRSMCRRLRQ